MIKNRINNRKTITIKCHYCGKEFEKVLSEYKRNNEVGRNNYCSRECAAKGNHITRTERGHNTPSEKLLQHLKSIQNNRHDELTPFRYTFRCVCRRYHEVNITLEYLKEVWEQQNGICPFTGIKLILPTDANLKNIDIFHRASIDRIDSTKGYVIGNVQFISTAINYLKNNSKDVDVKKFLKEISQFTSNWEEPIIK